MCVSNSKRVSIKTLFVLFIVTATLISHTFGKIYSKCALAEELRQAHHKLTVDHIATWVCIAQHESRFDTGAVNRGSGDHGLFQISDLYWCSRDDGSGGGNDGGKACHASCGAFEDDDITDDVQCIRTIYAEHQRLFGDGFQAWVVYPLYCKNLPDTYLASCNRTAAVPSHTTNHHHSPGGNLAWGNHPPFLRLLPSRLNIFTGGVVGGGAGGRKSTKSADAGRLLQDNVFWNSIIHTQRPKNVVVHRKKTINRTSSSQVNFSQNRRSFTTSYPVPQRQLSHGFYGNLSPSDLATKDERWRSAPPPPPRSWAVKKEQKNTPRKFQNAATLSSRSSGLRSSTSTSDRRHSHTNYRTNSRQASGSHVDLYLKPEVVKLQSRRPSDHYSPVIRPVQLDASTSHFSRTFSWNPSAHSYRTESNVDSRTSGSSSIIKPLAITFVGANNMADYTYQQHSNGFRFYKH